MTAYVARHITIAGYMTYMTGYMTVYMAGYMVVYMSEYMTIHD